MDSRALLQKVALVYPLTAFNLSFLVQRPPFAGSSEKKISPSNLQDFFK
jgi:hypothetical protein